MFRNALITSAITLGFAGAAQAQGAGPRLVGGGDNTEVVYAAPSRNVVGGGTATITGGADNLQIAYGSTTAQTPNGLVAEIIGGGDNRQIVYRPEASSTVMLAGQTAGPRG